MWLRIQINCSFKDGKRVGGAKFHERFVQTLGEQIYQNKKEELEDLKEETIITDFYIPCAEENSENARYLSGFVFIEYDVSNNSCVIKTLRERREVKRFDNVSDSDVKETKKRSKAAIIEQNELKINDAVKIIEEGDFQHFEGRIIKIEGDSCEVAVTIFNQDLIVKLQKNKVQKIVQNIEGYSLKIVK